MEMHELATLSSPSFSDHASQAVVEASAHQGQTHLLEQHQLGQEDHPHHLDHLLLYVVKVPQLARSLQRNSDTVHHHVVDQCSA